MFGHGPLVTPQEIVDPPIIGRMTDSHTEDALDPALLAPSQQLAADEISVPTAEAAIAARQSDTSTAHLTQDATATDAAPLVTGSLWRSIWIMTWPLMITTIGSSIAEMVDVHVAGMLGSSAQAAVGLAEQVIFLFMIFLMSLGVGTTAIVSRAYGEKNRKEADYVTAQSLSLSMFAGLALTLAAVLIAHYLLPLFTKAPEVIAQGDVYLTIFAFYMIPFSFSCIANAAFRAIGDAKSPLWVALAGIVVNVIGDYATVLYNWPIRGLGVRGIAAAAVASAVVSGGVALYCLLKSPLRHSVQQLLPVAGSTVKRLLVLGLPAAMQRASWAASVFVLFFILSRLPQPTPALAAWTIGMRVEALLFMPLMALSLAVGSIVGQSLGAKEIQRAIKAGWTVTAIGVWLMVVLASALFVYAEPLARIMSHDPKTVEFTAGYLRINALAEPLLAVNMILSGALQGAGDTRVPMWVSIFTNWVIRLPLAWALALMCTWGPNGVWAAMSASVVISAAIIAERFHSRGWVSLKV